MMLTIDDLVNAQEKQLWLEGTIGKLEAIVNGGLQQQNDTPATSIAILGHPHSLHGGTMNNKVITTLARACRDKGVPSLRFNFRGVGQSEGTFANGIGESEDVLAIIEQIKLQFPSINIILAGFSFGAYVTYRVASQTEVELLISVAPAVNHGDFCEFAKVPMPWHVLVANGDEIVAKQQILNWHKNVKPAPQLHQFEDASHFFHGKLVPLRLCVKEILESRR